MTQQERDDDSWTEYSLLFWAVIVSLLVVTFLIALGVQVYESV